MQAEAILMEECQQNVITDLYRMYKFNQGNQNII